MTKTLSFASLHFSVAFLLGWLFTGSLLVGGLLAIVEPACNTVVFHFHEKAWKRIEARRGIRGPGLAQPLSASVTGLAGAAGHITRSPLPM